MYARAAATNKLVAVGERAKSDVCNSKLILSERAQRTLTEIKGDTKALRLPTRKRRVIKEREREREIKNQGVSHLV